MGSGWTWILLSHPFLMAHLTQSCSKVWKRSVIPGSLLGQKCQTITVYLFLRVVKGQMTSWSWILIGCQRVRRLFVWKLSLTHVCSTQQLLFLICLLLFLMFPDFRWQSLWASINTSLSDATLVFMELVYECHAFTCCPGLTRSLLNNPQGR